MDAAAEELDETKVGTGKGEGVVVGVEEAGRVSVTVGVIAMGGEVGDKVV